MKQIWDCQAYACYDKLSENVLKSASGGVFGAFATYVLQQGGYVVGAAFTDTFEVEHIIIDKLEDLDQLRTSKYVQSRIGNVYLEIQKLLNNGKKVLFSGTPCQAGGLRAFLGEKTYDNLYIVDLICHGVPSPMVFAEHIKKMQEEHGLLKTMNFRCKDKGWKWYHTKYTFDSEECLISLADNFYSYGFNHNYFLRESCYQCKYKYLVSGADITLGDYWNIDTEHPEMWNDNKGVSAVIIKTERGEKLFDACKESLIYIPSTVEQISKYNVRILYPPVYSKIRKVFFEIYEKNHRDLEATYAELPQTSFGIVGGYASRLIIRQFHKTEAGNIVFQISNSSLISCMNKVSDITDSIEFSEDNPYRNMALMADVKKKLPFASKRYTALCDYLLIDFLEERFDVYHKGNAYVTQSEALVDRKINLDGWETLDKNETSALWEKACDEFILVILKNFDAKHIILNRIYLTEEWQGPQASGYHENLQNIHETNNQLRQYYDYFEAHCPGCIVIHGEMISDNATPEGFPYGCKPEYHNQKYYQAVANVIKDALDIKPVEIENLNKCTGCGACAQKCNHNAIEMAPEKDGFLYPVINEEKCVSCGLCSDSCPLEIKLI